eukprot:1160917-Pelagomonas_calceolata.AAC.6
MAHSLKRLRNHGISIDNPEVSVPWLTKQYYWHLHWAQHRKDADQRRVPQAPVMSTQQAHPHPLTHLKHCTEHCSPCNHNYALSSGTPLPAPQRRPYPAAKQGPGCAHPQARTSSSKGKGSNPGLEKLITTSRTRPKQQGGQSTPYPTGITPL